MYIKRNEKNFLLLLLFSVIGNGSSLQGFPRPRPAVPSLVLRTNFQLKVGAAMPVDKADSDLEPPSEILAGKSPKAIKLRKTLKEVWTSPKTSPILIVGPPGSGKGSIVEELLDRLPSSQKETVHKLPMNDAVSHIDTILGSESQPGLLDLLSDEKNTTLVLSRFQSRTVESAEEFGRRQKFFEAISKVVTDRTFYSQYEGKEKPFAPRIIATCSHAPESMRGADLFLVKVPALNARTQDMEAIATAKIKLFEKRYCLENVQMSLEATHRLLDHPWEDGEPELDDELQNALELLSTERQHNPDAPALLKSKHMLVKSWNESTRHRLLYEYPVLRKIIHSPWVFDHTLRYIVTPLFVLVLAALFLGPQTHDHNAALTVFWAGWWPAVMLSYPFLGRIW